MTPSLTYGTTVIYLLVCVVLGSKDITVLLGRCRQQPHRFADGSADSGHERSWAHSHRGLPVWPRGFSPGTDDHAGNAQKLELESGYQPPPQVPIYTLHREVETQAREVLHCGNFYQPVD